jgi:hypothetical protein
VSQQCAPIDTTADTTQSATPRNSRQPSAKKSAYLSRFCNIRQRLETGDIGLWLRRSRGRAIGPTRQTVAVARPDTTLIPPGTQYGAIRSNTEERKPLKYAAFATSCKPLQRLSDHS